jgi:hypothetical protein
MEQYDYGMVRISNRLHIGLIKILQKILPHKIHMTNVHTIKDISGGSSLGEPPLNRYPLSQIEQLSRAKKDRKTAIDWGNQVVDKYEQLDEENKHFRDDLNRKGK